MKNNIHSVITLEKMMSDNNVNMLKQFHLGVSIKTEHNFLFSNHWRNQHFAKLVIK